MNKITAALFSRHGSLLASLLLLTACVTVNVYFPAAAAESAADRFIRDVYGEDKAKDSEAEQTPAEEQSSLQGEQPGGVLVAVMNYLIAPAHAQQPDINISTPGINKLKSAMSARHEQLKPFYGSGAVGMDRNGFITIRDESAIPLKDRNTVKRLVNDENKDRERLYSEIAKANGHPEWEKDIQAIFASRWVANAPSGWWYKNESGQWVQK